MFRAQTFLVSVGAVSSPCVLRRQYAEERVMVCPYHIPTAHIKHSVVLRSQFCCAGRSWSRTTLSPMTELWWDSTNRAVGELFDILTRRRATANGVQLQRQRSGGSGVVVEEVKCSTAHAPDHQPRGHEIPKQVQLLLDRWESKILALDVQAHKNTHADNTRTHVPTQGSCG